MSNNKEPKLTEATKTRIALFQLKNQIDSISVIAHQLSCAIQVLIEKEVLTQEDIDAVSKRFKEQQEAQRQAANEAAANEAAKNKPNTDSEPSKEDPIQSKETGTNGSSS